MSNDIFAMIFFSFIGFLLSAPVILFVFHRYYKLNIDVNELLERVDFLENSFGQFISDEINKE